MYISDMKQLNKLGHPLFLGSLAVLLLNDFVWKTSFNNAITGKLSDFAGLFAFAYSFSCLLPAWTKPVHLMTGLLFILWKSPLAGPFIHICNHIGLPVSRVIDYTDLMALAVLPLSLLIYRRTTPYAVRPVVLSVILCISFFTFCATSQVRRDSQRWIAADRTYTFACSRQELVSRLNRETIKVLKSRIYRNHFHIDFDSRSGSFVNRDSKDTLARIIDYTTVGSTDTIVYNSSLVKVLIAGNDSISSLHLVQIASFGGNNDPDKYAMDAFEQEVIKKLRKPASN